MNKKIQFKIKVIVLLMIGILMVTSYASNAKIKTLENGDKISFDGSYYDFRDSAGVQMIKMWIPPDTKIIRGVFISGHGGGGGDSRSFARDENIRALAMRLGFAGAGLHNFPGREVYEKGAGVFFKALSEFAKMGSHPEIANLPFVIYGSSNGGATTYGFVNYAPERAICFVANVLSGGKPEIPVDAALKVPGIFIVGKFDALIGQRGIDRTEGFLTYAREKGALWAWALELKGHEDGTSFDVYMKLVEQAVESRYPVNGNPVNGPVELIEIEEKLGWLVDQNSWESGLTYVASVLTHDCNMTVKAAYGADGIYLLFDINDDNDVAWPNKFAGTENEQFYLNYDAVDVLIDSRSVASICDPDNMDKFVTKHFGLTFTTRQYQIACGTQKEKVLGFQRSLADPWDFNDTYYTFEDARIQFGLEIENIKTDYFHKAQEWFIPWSEYGGGFESEPDAGTRMGFAAGFNDRDEGEHFPPGVTSSGGSIKASNGIRWIGKSDPWGCGPRGGSPPYNWGEIELGSMLK